MTPKEKAFFLLSEMNNATVTLESFKKASYYGQQELKRKCLIAVAEILKSSPRYPSNVDWDDAGATHQYFYEAQREEATMFWQEVKTEIENL